MHGSSGIPSVREPGASRLPAGVLVRRWLIVALATTVFGVGLSAAAESFQSPSDPTSPTVAAIDGSGTSEMATSTALGDGATPTTVPVTTAATTAAPAASAPPASIEPPASVEPPTTDPMATEDAGTDSSLPAEPTNSPTVATQEAETANSVAPTTVDTPAPPTATTIGPTTTTIAPTTTTIAPTTTTTTVGPTTTTAAPTTTATTVGPTTTTIAPTTTTTTVGPTTTTAAPTGADDTAFASALVTLANQARAAEGIAPLTVSGSLTSYAQAWAIHLAGTTSLSHSDIGSLLGTWSTVGENVAAGHPSAAAMHAAWMASSGHRANILNPAFTHIGVAVVVDANGTPRGVEVFGG